MITRMTTIARQSAIEIHDRIIFWLIIILCNIFCACMFISKLYIDGTTNITQFQHKCQIESNILNITSYLYAGIIGCTTAYISMMYHSSVDEKLFLFFILWVIYVISCSFALMILIMPTNCRELILHDNNDFKRYYFANIITFIIFVPIIICTCSYQILRIYIRFLRAQTVEINEGSNDVYSI